MTRDEIDAAILAHLTWQWTTPKQLSKVTGIPWRVLMRACPRLQLYGKIMGRLDHVVALKHRKRPQRRYRCLPDASTAVYDLLVPKFDASTVTVVGAKEHYCMEEPPPRLKIALGYRG